MTASVRDTKLRPFAHDEGIGEEGEIGEGEEFLGQNGEGRGW